MTLIRARATWLILLLAALGLSSPSVFGNPAQAEEMQLKKVATIYHANRKLMQSVECAYVYRLNGAERRCRYARLGEKYYHASVDILSESRRGLPREVAWDGQIAASRSEIGELIRGRNSEIASTTCDSPDAAAFVYVDQALGFRPEPKHGFKFRQASQVESPQGECIELHFDMASTGGKVITRHARDFSYLPVAVKVYDKDGVLCYDLEEIVYEEQTQDHNSLVYPVRSVGVSFVDGSPVNRTTVEVDRVTLRIGQPVAPTRFVLEPWPIDTVYDADTRKVQPMQDRKWFPVGKVGFPWDVYFESKSPSEWAAVFASKFAPANAAKPPSDGGNNRSTSPAVPVAAATGTDTDLSLLWWGSSIAGALVIVGALAWNYTQHRKTQ